MHNFDDDPTSDDGTFITTTMNVQQKVKERALAMYKEIHDDPV